MGFDRDSLIIGLLVLLALPVVGLAAIAMLTYLMPLAFPRLAVGCVLNLLYRLEVRGQSHVPMTGPVLLVPNHVSWLDGLLVQYCSPRPARFVVYGGNFRAGWLRWLADQWRTILIDTNPKSIARALRDAREGLAQGDAVCFFPEGAISRTGYLQEFKPGILKVRTDPNVPVVPVYVTGVWKTIFSFERGRFFWKWPNGFRLRVAVTFGAPSYPRDLFEYRQLVCDLGAEAVSEHMNRERAVAVRVIESCQRRKFVKKIADSAGEAVTGGEALMRSLILRRLLRRHVLADDERNVGVLLPPSVGGVLTNLALLFDRRVAINLNYTVSGSVLDDCLQRADVRHVLTTRRVLDKLDVKLHTNLVFLEDLRPKVTLADKLVAGLQAYVLPASVVSSSLKLNQVTMDDDLTIVFTSGSTGVPKGVVLTQRNVMSNILAIEQVIRLTHDDVLIGILPFFHSFGLTVALHTVMSLDVGGAYHFNPLDARQVGKLVREHKGTILLATPTFLRSYARRCTPEDFATLDTVVAGAEKLPVDLCQEFEAKFGVRPVEGYGTTELSPLVSVNVPASRRLSSLGRDACEGSVGKPIPGVAAKVIDPETLVDLPANTSGMLLIKGPNVMKGYLKQPEKTAEVIRDGWYVTGDIAKLDEEGFIHITDRQSRFSKIGGEMVPHGQVEEELLRQLGSREDELLPLAVTAIPDPRKGERLVVVHQPQLGKTPAELCDGLRSAGLPNLFIPGQDSFLEIPQLPLLGTGKLDLKRIKQIALERLAAET